MNNKGFVNIVLIGIVVILLGIGGYFVWSEYGPQPCAQSLLPAEAVNKKTGEKKIFEYPCAVPRGWVITDYHPATTPQPTPIPTPQPSPTPTPQSTSFNLIFKYGVGAKNELNTFAQTYTKDMVMDPSVTIKLKLTDNELTGIYQKLNDLKLFNESTKPIEGNVMVTPCSSYYLKVQINSEQKELSWNNCRGRISDKFQQFTSYVIQIIESKEEYKKLPTPQGGYL